ncbi:glycosyltransferase [Vicingaceae bacterium]|nr:glycosyltransferase [Vicingaceae bacterium]
MNRKLKVAIVHDWFTVDGGAEKVCREIINLYPEADVFSLIDFLSDSDRITILKGKKSTTSIIQKFPFAKKYYRYYLPWFPYAIEQINLTNYDLIISSSYAVAKGVLTHSNQVHVCYCHSPMRYLWDLYFSYIPKSKWSNFPIAYFMRHYISKLRQWDVISSNRVDAFIANSNNIAKRIKKVYRRESTVVYPPLFTDKFPLVNLKEDYYVSASRLVPYKKVELAILAFKKLPNKRLKIIGDGPEYLKLRQLAKGSPNIEMLGFLEEADFASVIGKAKAFINSSFEDFGIAPVEAQACGTPIIGYAKGGVLETTIENNTAIYFHEQTPEAIIEAIEKFEKATLWTAQEIHKYASSFNNKRFAKEFTKVVEQCLSSHF